MSVFLVGADFEFCCHRSLLALEWLVGVGLIDFPGWSYSSCLAQEVEVPSCWCQVAEPHLVPLKRQLVQFLSWPRQVWGRGKTRCSAGQQNCQSSTLAYSILYILCRCYPCNAKGYP